MIPIAKPNLGSLELSAIERVLKTGWIAQGPEVERFEIEFANYVGCDYACAVANGTAAIHLALKAAGVKQGDEVITVSYSFIATANAIRYCGAIPVFIDINPVTQNIEPDHIENVVSEKTTAILCVHQFGMPCDISRITKIGQRYGLAIVEDAACALGSEFKQGDIWRKIGSQENSVACFSFHPRKVLTTGEGGMIVTGSKVVDERVRTLRQHSLSDSESYNELGFNYRMTDIHAAIGRVQLGRMPEILQSRRRLAERYASNLKSFASIKLPQDSEHTRTNWQSYPIILQDRHQVTTIMKKMEDMQIAVKPGIPCAHKQLVYTSEPCVWSELPISEQIQDRSLLLPIYENMTNGEQDLVIGVIHQCLCEMS